MEMIPYSVVRFCSIEAKMQMSGELSVMRMVDAMVYAKKQSQKKKLPTVIDVLEIGKLVEPYDNAKGFRRQAIQIGPDLLPHWQEIPRQIVLLMESLRDTEITPDEFFLAYERVHPFLTATAVADKSCSIG